jgi:hypothetical protein
MNSNRNPILGIIHPGLNWQNCIVCDNFKTRFIACLLAKPYGFAA